VNYGNTYYNGAWAAYGPYAMYQQVLAATTYADFNNRVNSYGHQAIHVWVNGYMSNLQSAAMDPVFFFVHAFVDALWAAWQQCGAVIPLPTDYATNPKVWSWGSPQLFEGDGASMPFFTQGRTPKYAKDISAHGNKYTTGFIYNVVAIANSKYCANRGSSFVNPALVAAQERIAKRNAVYHDLRNPPVIVATNFIEAFTPASMLAAPGKPKKSAKAIAAAKRKKLLALSLGTDSKPACYQPKKDEVTNLKATASVLKKYKRMNKIGEALSAVTDTECGNFEYTSALVVSPQFAESMGSNAIKRRAQGAYHHTCYLRQNGKKADSLKSDYQKDLEKRGRYRKPKRVAVARPTADFKTIEESGPPPVGPPPYNNTTPGYNPSGYKNAKVLFQDAEQNALGPM
jgi:hypothetical protein